MELTTEAERHTVPPGHYPGGTSPEIERTTEDKWRKRFDALMELDKTIAASDSLRQLLQSLSEGIVSLFPEAKLCFIWQSDPVKNTLFLVGKCSTTVTYRSSCLKIPFDSVSGSLVEGRLPYKTEYDVQNKDIFYCKEMAKELGLQGMLAVLLPGFKQESPLGCINVYTTNAEYRFPEEDCELLVNIANSASAAFRQLSDSLTLSSYNEIGSYFESNGGSFLTPAVLERVAKITCGKLDAAACSIFLYEPGNYLRLCGTTDDSVKREQYSGIRIPLGNDMIGWVGQQKTPLRLLFSEEKAAEFLSTEWTEPSIFQNQKKRSFLVVPIGLRHERIGVIRVISQPDTTFLPTDQGILEAIARYIAPDMKRERQINESMKTLAHQLVAPIHAMEAGCKELLAGASSVEREEIVLNSLADTCQLAFTIAHNFSIIQKIVEGSHPKIIKRRVRLWSLLLRAAQLHQPYGREERIFISLKEGNIESLRIEADEDLLLQVFLNLFDNAIKYSFRNSTVQVYLHDLNKTNFTMCVESEGIPIRQDELLKVFERSYRTALVEKLMKPGMGIGLPVARAIVEGHGGRIWAESNPLENGSGAARVRFFITLQIPRA